MAAAVAEILSLTAGDRLGSYEIVRPIAEGGMGAVYEVEHRVTKQRRALKVVRSELATKADFRARFVREVTIASSVKHPNLVDTQDPIEMDGMLALPMELLEGETLSARLRRGKLAVLEALDVIVPCARAVHAVHERSVIHRDLKPLNIFLATQGARVVPKVLDFGAARELDDDEHTRTGLVIGSPFYMAPEQAEGRKDLDVRVDIYAMGVIAYFCLTGRRLYETDSAQSAVAKLLRAEPYPRPSELDPTIPNGIEAAVLTALAYEREERWPTMAAFADALLRAAHPSVAVAAPPNGEATLLRDITVGAAGGDAPSGVRASAPSSSSPFASPPSRPKPNEPSREARTRVTLAASAVIVAIALALAWWVTRPRDLHSIADEGADRSVHLSGPLANTVIEGAPLIEPHSPPTTTMTELSSAPVVTSPPPTQAAAAPSSTPQAPVSPSRPGSHRSHRTPSGTPPATAAGEPEACGIDIGIPCLY